MHNGALHLKTIGMISWGVLKHANRMRKKNLGGSFVGDAPEAWTVADGSVIARDKMVCVPRLPCKSPIPLGAVETLAGHKARE